MENNLPIAQRKIKNPVLFRRLALFTSILCFLGLLMPPVRELHFLHKL